VGVGYNNYFHIFLLIAYYTINDVLLPIVIARGAVVKVEIATSEQKFLLAMTI
jgi:hypothetical protein